MIPDGYPEELLAHDDRCDAPLGGSCNCADWERFDAARAEIDDGPCDCGYGTCYGDCDEYEEADRG